MIDRVDSTASVVSPEMLRSAVRDLRLQDKTLCVHSSLRSFGTVVGGASAVIDALLEEGCTVMVPTFSTSAYEVWPVPRDLIPQNAWGVDAPSSPTPGTARVYRVDAAEIDADMGAIAASVLAKPARIRGAHSLNSFTAVGPQAHDLIDRQSPDDVFGPLNALIETRGLVLLMGVGLNCLTLLHVAEQRAGRQPFVRWATDPLGRVVRVRVGGCSEGFHRLAPILAPLTVTRNVGRSRWHVLPADAVVAAATAAIRREPTVTHCEDPACTRCSDAVLGGPVMPEHRGPTFDS